MFFPYGDTAVASYAPTRPESCVNLFEKGQKKKKKIFRYSTNQPQCSIVYVFIVYRNVDVIRKIIRKNSRETWLDFLVPFLSPEKA